MKEGQNDIVNTNHLPPKLDLPYEAPYAYFEHLPNRIQSRMDSSKSSKKALLHGWRWSALAATVLLAIGLFWWQQSLEESVQVSLNELSQEDINNYLLAHSDVPTLMVLAEREQIEWQVTPELQALSENELLPWIEDAELLNAMEEL